MEFLSLHLNEEEFESMVKRSTNTLLSKREYDRLSAEVKAEVVGLFKNNQKSGHCFHTLQHTEQIVEAAQKIANHYQIEDHEFFLLTTAAWFLNTGFLSKNENPIQKSQKIAQQFLEQKGVEATVVKDVSSIIQFTNSPSEELLAQILRDARLYYLASNNFVEIIRQRKAKKEWEKEVEYSDKEWRDVYLRFMQRHEYQTDLCRLLWNDLKNENFKTLKSAKL